MKRTLGRLLLATFGFVALTGRVEGQAPRETRPPVYVEDSPAAQDALDKARDLRKQSRLPEAAAAYQRLFDQHGQRLMSAGEATYTDAARLAKRDILTDPPLLTAYRDSQGAAAQFETARARGAPNEAVMLEETLSRFTLTRAGFDAGLRLAALLLEQARPIDATSVLNLLMDHPDLAESASRWRLLTAAAALQEGNRLRTISIASEIRHSGDQEAIKKLDGWLASTHPPAQSPVITPGLPAPATPLPDRLSTALWRIDLADSPGGSGARGGRAVGTLGVVQPTAALLLPVVRGERMLLNNGNLVMAADTSSGRVAWTYTVEEADNEAVIRPWQRPGTRFSDPRGVAVLGNRIAAVVGATSSTNPMRNSTTAVVCLDDNDGSLLWQVEPKNIDDTLSTAFFHGTPIAVENRFIVLLRRSQMLGFQDAYITALDATTGKPLWRRYLASSSSINRQPSRFLSQVTRDGHWLYVADNLGSVSRIDSRSGAVDWLRTLTDITPMVGEGAEMRKALLQGSGRGSTSGSWIPSPPILTTAGVIVPAPSGTNTAVLVDAATGKRIRDLSEPQWTDGDYLLPLDGDVLSVGATVRRIHGTTLEVRWSAPLQGEPDARPRGVAAVTADRLAVPLADRVVLLNLSDGAVVTTSKVESTANLTAIDGQLLVTHNESVRSYMEWEAASQRLRARAVANPRDPRPSLSLAHLAAASDQKQAMLDAIDLAITAARANAETGSDPEGGGVIGGPAARQEVFRYLLGMAENTRVINAESRGLIFERLGGLTSGAGDEVAFQLAMGVYLTQGGKLADAAERFQAVIMNPSLATQAYERGTGLRQAGLEAQMRLASLIRDGGPGIYARFDAMAAQRLNDLTASSADPATFLEAARQYPLSRSVPALLLAAAEALDSRGDSSAALVQLRRAYAAGNDAALRSRIVGRMAELHTRIHQPRLAIQWLERLRRDHPDAKPIRQGKPVDFGPWIAELAKMPSGEVRLASLTLPLAQPQVLEGRLLVPEAQRAEAQPRDRLFLWQSGRLTMRRGTGLETAWEINLHEPPALQWVDAQRTLLLEPAAGALHCVDGNTGRTQWRVELRPLLEQAGGDAQRQAQRPAEERRFVEQLNPQGVVIRNRKVIPLRQAMGGGENALMVRMNDAIALAVDRKGRAAALDRKTGKLLWRSLLPLERVAQLEMDADSLVMAGLLTLDMEDQGGALIVLDPLTGEPRCPTIEEKSVINWVGMGGDGVIAYSTASELVARHAVDGSVAWRLSIPPETITGQAWFGGDLLLLREAAGAVAVIDPTPGRVVNRLMFAAPNQAGVLRPVCIENAWHVLTGTQLITLAPDGPVRWRDAIGLQAHQPILQLVGDEHIAILAKSGPLTTTRVMAGNLPNDPMQRLAAALQNMNQMGDPAGQPNVRLEVRAAVLPEVDTPPSYRLYLIDRRSGVLLEERDLGPVRDPIEPQTAQFLDGQLVFTTRGATIVVPGARATQGVVP